MSTTLNDVEGDEWISDDSDFLDEQWKSTQGSGGGAARSSRHGASERRRHPCRTKEREPSFSSCQRCRRRNQRIKIEESNLGRPIGAIARIVRPYREKLEDDVLSLAVNTDITSGKWMFFLHPDRLTETWRLIAEATSQGKLGPGSKVATWEPSPARAERLICVYTYDFMDTDDVRRVLQELVNLGSVGEHDRPIYYKCDAYTYLDLMSVNEYKIKASLFSNKDVLGNAVNVNQGGSVLRLKKRIGAVDGC